MTLTEFLLARVAEVEVAVRCSGRGLAPVDRWDMRGYDQPARILGECEAKRRIVEEHGPLAYFGPRCPPRCASCAVWEEDDYEGPPGVDYPCPTLRLLALPYADHPDYRDEWKP